MTQANPPPFVRQSESRTRWLKSLEQRDARRYFKSGFKKHDLAVGALLRGALYLIAARAGVGKTAFMFSLAYRQILAGVRVYFCNLEMSVEQMWNRLARLHDSDLTLRELDESNITPERSAYFTRLAQELENFPPLFFESNDIAALATAARAEITPSSDSVLCLDYVGF